MNHSTLSPASNVDTSPSPSDLVLVRGIGVEVAPSLHTAAVNKAGRLLRHQRRIVRIRIDFEHERASHCREPAIASGRIEISGPDIVARVSATSLPEALDLLMERLDRMLRERTKHRVNRRNDRPAGVEFRDLLAPPASSVAQ